METPDTLRKRNYGSLYKISGRNIVTSKSL